jgi:hypothetical protein
VTREKRDTAFALVPNYVLPAPPIGKGLLTPFEFRTLWAVLAHARLYQARPARVGTLLKMMLASDHSRNADRLEAALARLHDPIGEWPPLLIAIRQDFSLHVDPHWLPDSHFTVVAAPPPSAIPLWLFLHVIDKRKAKFKWTRLRILAARLGISNDHPRRTLQRNLGAINRHLARLDLEALAAHGIRLPTSFDLWIEGDRVSFIPDWGAKDETKRKRKPKRARQRDDDDYFDNPDHAAEMRYFEMRLAEPDDDWQGRRPRRRRDL